MVLSRRGGGGTIPGFWRLHYGQCETLTSEIQSLEGVIFLLRLRSGGSLWRKSLLAYCRIMNAEKQQTLNYMISLFHTHLFLICVSWLYDRYHVDSVSLSYLRLFVLIINSM